MEKVGIAWRGGTPKTRGGLRSLSLDALGPLLDCAGTTFVVLQRDLKAEERAWLEKKSNVFVPDAVSDLGELAALLSVLDLTITVPNTNLHLAGALGRPVWGLLTKSPEWRYLWQGESMPWYPSARLFRQPVPGEWRAVIEQARAALRCCDD